MDDGCVLYLCNGSVYNSSISVMDGGDGCVLYLCNGSVYNSSISVMDGSGHDYSSDDEQWSLSTVLNFFNAILGALVHLPPN